MTERSLRVPVLLSVQRALWGMVTPDLRAVAVGWNVRNVRLRFVYDHPVGQRERELASEVETEVLSDMEPEVVVTTQVVHAPEPRIGYLDGEEWWAYLRRET